MEPKAEDERRIDGNGGPEGTVKAAVVDPLGHAEVGEEADDIGDARERQQIADAGIGEDERSFHVSLQVAYAVSLEGGQCERTFEAALEFGSQLSP
jgi:hypothetical protein